MKRKELRKKKKEINLLQEIITIINQYLPELIEKFDGLTDIRNQFYVKYKMKVIFIVRLLALISSIKSMNELTSELNTEEAIVNIAKICKLELDEIPHCDTINNVFENVKIEELREINKYIITSLIRSKMFNRFKIRNKYFHIVVDGTGLASSRVKYNENCLVKNKTDKNGKDYKEYSTYVLEAKLIVGDMVFSIGSEFVENEKEDVEKQDCEINAFKRLAIKIKKDYPRLPIIIGGDALYACKPVMDICKENKWRYVIKFKEGKIPTLYQEFTTIVKRNDESEIANYNYVTSLDYEGHKTNMIKYIEIDEKTEFIYITNLLLKNSNVMEMVQVGRKRWKIENEGFNIQKNGTFDIGHLYSKNSTAIKVHYFLIQVAHLIRQLLEKGVKEVKELKLKIKEISKSIKDCLTSNFIANLDVHKRIQLRFE